jgi:lipopolysaccharide transport system permease protein
VASIYLLVFGFVFGRKVAGEAAFPGDFPSYVLIGLVPWLATQAVLTRSTTALLGNAGLVKQVIFPVEALPVAVVGAVALSYAPAFALVLGYKAFFAGGLPGTAILLLPLLALHAALATGLAFLLAAVTPFVRDVREGVNVLSQVAMYLTPAVYLPSWVPEPLRPLLYLNPFSYLTWAYQDALFFGAVVHPVAWIVLAGLALGALVGGHALFRRLRPFYGNVL